MKKVLAKVLLPSLLAISINAVADSSIPGLY